MNEPGLNREHSPTLRRVLAWLAWSGFLLFCLGACIFAEIAKSDAYFVRHYEHFPKEKITLLMTSYPVWMPLLSFLWLPWVISLQHNSQATWKSLLLLKTTMFIVALTLAVLLLCAGPPIQM